MCIHMYVYIYTHTHKHVSSIQLGFIHTFHMAMRVKPAGISVHAPVCSSWGRLNRATSGRSPSTVLGNLNRDYVKKARVQIQQHNKHICRSNMYIGQRSQNIEQIENNMDANNTC